MSAKSVIENEFEKLASTKKPWVGSEEQAFHDDVMNPPEGDHKWLDIRGEEYGHFIGNRVANGWEISRFVWADYSMEEPTFAWTCYVPDEYWDAFLMDVIGGKM